VEVSCIVDDSGDHTASFIMSDYIVIPLPHYVKTQSNINFNEESH
jgi:hypothetical protein